MTAYQLTRKTTDESPRTPPDPDRCREAVEQRDPTYDGVFVVAVRSTGIYCRPTCPSRKPKPENMVFYATTGEAAAAGYRACKRCQPDTFADQGAVHTALVAQVCEYLQAAETAPSLQDLSEHFHLSPYHLQRVFKRITGVSPRQYYDAHRAEQFKSSLKEGEPVTRALYEAGYNSSSQVYRNLPGMTPTAYQRGGEGQTIRYYITPCYLGLLLVAATERGLCAVRLADTRDGLLAQLHDEFPAAALIEDETATGDAVRTILAYLNRQPAPMSDLPLDIQATAFQRRVWEALRAIPYGVTRSYSDIARDIGQPKAVRAVAQACGANPVPLVIPCHRVVRSNGDLGGYNMGIERKVALLQAEGILPDDSDQPQQRGLFDSEPE